MIRPYSSRVRRSLPIIPGFSKNDMISSNREEAFDVYATVMAAVLR